MPRTAVLLVDLQVDFLDTDRGRMPVSPDGARRVIEAANAVLAGQVLAGALAVLIVNRYPVSAKVANLFRRGAAVVGSAGAAIDPRILGAEDVVTFPKQQASAFTNPELEPYLRREGVDRVWVVGVFAEACVRATALDARRRGFEVTVAAAAMATDAAWKARLAAWALKRGGVTVVETLGAAPRAA